MKNILLFSALLSILQLTIGCSNDVSFEQGTKTEPIPATEGTELPTGNSTSQEIPDPVEIVEGETAPAVTEPGTETEPPTGTEPPVGTEPSTETEPPTVPPLGTEPPISTEPPIVTEPPTVTEPATETEPPTGTEPVSGTPKMLINELRTEYNLALNKAEFIEFKALSAGNLEGIKLNILYEKDNPYIFSLPAVQVKESEYITFHLRTLESGCVNELGDDLTLSGGTDSNPDARDLWVEGSNKWLYGTAIVYLQDAEGNFLDTVVMLETPSVTWGKARLFFGDVCAYLHSVGAWKLSSVLSNGCIEAVDTSGATGNVNKSVSRREGSADTNTKADWYITVVNGNTPGGGNL